MSGTLPSGQLSAIPWRRSSVKYTNNEAYFDVIEEVDASKSSLLLSIAEYAKSVSFLLFQSLTKMDKLFLLRFRDM